MPADNVTPIAGLARKLGRLATLNGDDLTRLSSLQVQMEQVARFKLLVREGDVPTRCCLLVRGYAARFKETAMGARQIVAFHMAGDLLDVQHLLLSHADPLC